MFKVKIKVFNWFQHVKIMKLVYNIIKKYISGLFYYQIKFGYTIVIMSVINKICIKISTDDKRKQQCI